MKHIIVYGPKGCGKSYNRIAIMKHFGADRVIDDWKGARFFDPSVKGPFDDGRVVKIKGNVAPAHTVVYLYTSLNYDRLLPSPLPDRPQGDRLVVYNYVDLAFVRKESDDPLVELGLSEPRGNTTIPDDASVFQSSRTETDRPSDEDLMRTIIDACDELRDRGYKVGVSDKHDPAERPNTRTTHVTLIKKMKGDAKCNDQQQ